MGDAKTKLDHLHHNRIGDCTRCRLHKDRTKVVYGDGNPDADIVFVGEAPGYHEDMQGVPFVGQAGKMLNRMLADAGGIERGEVFITNQMKCRPEGNRDPWDDELATCGPFLDAQLWIIQPKVLVALGRFAGNYLAGRPNWTMHRLSQDVWRYRNDTTDLVLPLVVLYHPAYMLRYMRNSENTKDQKRKLYEGQIEQLRIAVEIAEGKRVVEIKEAVIAPPAPPPDEGLVLADLFPPKED